ncbi:hypothetical protein [Burkholderia sp. BCC0405]|uniref:hypothetical protein n=1 Tax=Burkholderia sp. BCC0405 TaxID=2676298 RepID=UPI00158F49B4|nr:hypothetical protein [Burkholderia sp. BCC0405]
MTTTDNSRADARTPRQTHDVIVRAIDLEALGISIAYTMTDDPKRLAECKRNAQLIAAAFDSSVEQHEAAPAGHTVYAQGVIANVQALRRLLMGMLDQGHQFNSADAILGVIEESIDEAMSDAHAQGEQEEKDRAANAQPEPPAADERDDDADDYPATPESERAAFNGMMRWHLIRLLQAWRYGGDLRAVGMAAFEWARANDVGKEAFRASEKAVKLFAPLEGTGNGADERVAQMAHDLRCAGVAGTKAGGLLHAAAEMLEALGARAPRIELAGAVPIQAGFLTEDRKSEIARKCEVECHASPGTNMWQCAYMAIEETINALAEPHLSTWIAEVCEDADGYKHIEPVIEALDDLPKGMKLYGAPQPPSPDAAAAPADERAAFYVHKNAVQEICEHGFDFTQTQIFARQRSDNYVPIYLRASGVAPQPPSADAAAEDKYVIERLSTVLAGVAAALLGEEADRPAAETLQKLPEEAAKIRLELDLYRAQAADAAAAPVDERAAFSRWANANRVADTEFHFSIWSGRAAASQPADERAAFEAWWYEREAFGLRAERLDTPEAAARAAWNERAGASKPAANPPFENCQFRACDLPGQCRSEGACHHPKPAAAAGQAIAGGIVGAWVTDDDRSITAAQKQRALADGGATASSVRPYSIPCYLDAPPAQVAARQGADDAIDLIRNANPDLKLPKGKA